MNDDALVSAAARWRCALWIKPARAPATPSERQPAAVLRDQFAALLVARYDALRLCASAVLGPTQAAAAIPALRASAGHAAVAATADTPTG